MSKPNKNNNNTIFVKNIKGTSQDRYVIPKLAQKFHQAKGTNSSTCQAYGCSKEASATAHVKFDDHRKSQDWQNVRFCAEHNHHTLIDPIPTKKNAKIVPLKSLK